jgi:hypothetical protein
VVFFVIYDNADYHPLEQALVSSGRRRESSRFANRVIVKLVFMHHG